MWISIATPYLLGVLALAAPISACDQQEGERARGGPRVTGPSSLPAEAPDTELEHAVRRELMRDPGIRHQSISVASADGTIELSGKVWDLLTSERAARIAGLVRGVRSVRNTLDLEIPTRPDAELRREVKAAFLTDPAAESYEIEVDVADQVVRLRGKVQSWQEKQLAERLAKTIRGVRAVENDVLIDYGVEQRGDREILADVRSRLRWDALVREGRISVTVNDAKVELGGTVGSLAEKERAQALAWVHGVTSVDDSKLEVRPWARDEVIEPKLASLPPGEIEDAIRAAARYEPRVERSELEVQVSGGIATLRGVVDSISAKMAAEALARETAGVLDVKNEIRVEPPAATDYEIMRRVKSALAANLGKQEFAIEVASEGGRVTLKGRVENAVQKERAGSVAAGVRGVGFVDNRLEVEDSRSRLASSSYSHRYIDPHGSYDGWRYLPPTAARSDLAIAEAIEDELRWSPFVDAVEVRVSVREGTATLTGTVDSWLERNAATESALEGGATAVYNNLVVQ